MPSRSRAHDRRPATRRAVVLCALALLAAFTPVLADTPQIAVELHPTSVPVGGEARLTVTLEGFSRAVQEPQVPTNEGYDIYEAGSSTSMQWINGDFSSSVTHTYILAARREGRHAVGPVEITDQGTLYRSDPLELTVRAPASSPPSGAAAAAPAGGAGGPHAGQADDGGTAGEALFARVVVDREEAYLDQQVTLRFQLYQRDDLTLLDIGGFEPPTTEGFWREDLGSQRDYRATVGGEPYRVREIAWALFPTRAGRLEIGPARIVCRVPEGRPRSRGRLSDFFDRSMFDSRRVPLSTAPVAVEVLPLPQAGQPAGFTGSVGEYALDVRFDSEQLRQGEPFGLVATVRGRGHIQTIGAPRWPDWEGVRVFDSGEAVSVHREGDRFGGEKSFTQVLIPNRAGQIELGPVRFAYFDPLRGRYRELVSDSLVAEVAAGAAVAAGGGGIRPVGEDIRYIHTGFADHLEGPQSPAPRTARWVHLLPVVGVGAAGWIRLRRRRLERDPRLRRRQAAARLARDRLAAIARAAPTPSVAGEAAAVLEAYLGDWLGQSVRGWTRRHLADRLLDAGLPEQPVAEVSAFLAGVDEVRFAGGTASAEELCRRLDKLLQELEAAWRVTPWAEELP